jgi:hypothetical protein
MASAAGAVIVVALVAYAWVIAPAKWMFRRRAGSMPDVWIS